MDDKVLESITRKLENLPSVIAKDEAMGGSFSRIGLQNVMERMRMVFGERYQCKVYSKPGQGTVVEMLIPERGKVDADV